MKPRVLERLRAVVRFLVMVVSVGCLMAPGTARAVESADALYKQGRFQDAMARYNALDMEHPKDLRYRYNRGCAAYQAGEYEAAMAAFSSVLRRADAIADQTANQPADQSVDQSAQLKSKALYNMGNAAFQQDRFESAATYYKQALQNDATAMDARHNLELALRRLAEQNKKRKDGDQAAGGDSGEDGGDAKEKDDGSKADPSDPSEAPDSPTGEQKRPSDAGKSQRGDDTQTDKPTDGDKEKDPAAHGKENNEMTPKAGTRNKENQEALSGDLTGPEKMPNATAASDGERKQPGGVSMGRQKAEALLDNVTEDREKFLRFQVPEGKDRVRSGKDW